MMTEVTKERQRGKDPVPEILLKLKTEGLRIQDAVKNNTVAELGMTVAPVAPVAPAPVAPAPAPARGKKPRRSAVRGLGPITAKSRRPRRPTP